MFVEIKDQRIPQWIKEGKVFIYPTDTIYGIGCNADNEISVKRIREIKNSEKPFSVIGPNKIWIKGLLISNYCENHSHYLSTKSLSDWLIENEIPALSNIDTRELTLLLRDNGSMKGKIVFDESPMPDVTFFVRR